MAGTVSDWSEFTGDSRKIAEIVDRDGEARVERGGEKQLVLVEAERYDAAIERLETLTRLVRYQRLTRSVKRAVKETFPWTGASPPDGQEEFFAEFVETFKTHKDLDVLGAAGADARRVEGDRRGQRRPGACRRVAGSERDGGHSAGSSTGPTGPL